MTRSPYTTGLEPCASLGAGANDVTVTAVDGLGNETVETRTVAWLTRRTAEWQVAGAGQATNVRLRLLDGTGRSLDVGPVALEAHGAGGVHGPFETDWRGQRYQYVLRALPPDDYDLVARLEIQGWEVVLTGPTLTVR